MAAKDYDGAIKAYGEAIEHDDKNPVYWSNRRVGAIAQLPVALVLLTRCGLRDFFVDIGRRHTRNCKTTARPSRTRVRL